MEDGLDGKKMLYITGSVLALAVIVFVITFLIYGNKLNHNTKLAKTDRNNNTIGNLVASEETSSSMGKTVNEMQEGSKTNNQNTEKIAVNTSQETENTTTTTKTNPKTNQENATTKPNKTVEPVKDPEFKMPVTGEVVKEFADNKLVYSSTLDVWATHNGVDIKADKTTVVKASADGKVASIKNDPRYGLTVIIEHVNGYKTVYANLLSTEFVVEGETVKQGQSLGTVGNTAAFEVSDEPHLHFELLKNNEQQDPELYLKK
ncbi:MAG: M23 family metallopeptidase, partial [Clostridia bacterium]|nr:M23 family metallopeptidase [Clostridia bacterium]